MESTVLNRLVAARDLIEGSGPSLGTYAPASLVGRKLLAAHDAAELVSLALASLPSAAPADVQGKPQRDPSFMTLARWILKYATALHHELSDVSYLRTFEDLVEARKLFKHSGMLVDPVSNAPLFTRTVTILDVLCTTLLGYSLQDIDLISAVHAEQVRAMFKDAKQALEDGNFQLSLESTALALAEVFWRQLTPLSPTVGKPSAEEALLLSGKGIDPSSFLAMQQFLPLTYHPNDEPRWTLREHGHAGNWTRESAAFCLSTAVDATVKLQNSATHPFASDFYRSFIDVIEVTHPAPESYWVQNGIFTSDGNFRILDGFQVGDRITGRARAHINKFEKPTENLDESLNYSEWISVSNPKTDRMIFSPTSLLGSNTLWFRKDQVNITYQESEICTWIRDLRKKQE